MAFGVYVHIPYCLQICPYCDFTKYELGTIMPPEAYVELLRKEIRARVPTILSLNGPTEFSLDSLYFGGGTPSLLAPRLILSILEELANAGLRTDVNTEITLEIDPGSIDHASDATRADSKDHAARTYQNKIDTYLAMGVNRFSVGAQTFNSRLLKLAGRNHSAQDTVNLLSILKTAGVNYSFDLLFALPSQTLAEVRADLATVATFDPSHLSAYCLTVPDSHPMAKGRAPDDEQREMFALIEATLKREGLLRYEISNFARPGRESRHNLLYWTDQPYLGLGTSAHSYLPRAVSPWGTRFWNAPSVVAYEKQICAGTNSRWDIERDVPLSQLEILKRHQALTDFCHTSLRLARGLDENALRLKFGAAVSLYVARECATLMQSELVQKTPTGWSLTEGGRMLANVVFEKLTFLEGELPSED